MFDEELYEDYNQKSYKIPAIISVFAVFLAVGALFFSPFLFHKALTAAVKEEVRGVGADDGDVSEEVLDLNDQIQEQKDKIDELKRQSERYQKQINANRSQAVTLSNEIALLDNQAAKIEIDIAATEAEIEQTQLEIEKTEKEIEEKETEIDVKKESLANYIRTLNQIDDVEYLEILLLNNSFSEFFDQVQYLENMQSDVREVLTGVIALKEELDAQKKDLENRESDLEELVEELEHEQLALENSISAKGVLLDQTRESEKNFQSLLSQVKAEQQAISSELAALERQMRQKLESSDSNFVPGGEVILSWPIPKKGITATFHDPDYPFRYIFEHPAIDLRASQGTPIKAPAAGYVGRAKDNGFGYNYLMLIHNGGISTVYGHVSKFAVSEDQYVTRGQVVAYTGGTPGTPGAGRLTTGPHLHFEVRLDGIPVNPLDYLID